ncbi:MAG TPA: MFS transporter [Jatrophihabitans sp.]|jgi:EmrB/QacA subfamily drug resistance transporter
MAANEVTERRAPEAQAGSRRWLVLVIVSIAQLMVVLDATVVNIALPSAQADLAFGDSQRQWIVTAYALAFGSLLLLGGRVGDLVGRKRIFLIALVAFAAASALGGAAPSFGVLVVARAIQGVAGAMLAPAALGTLIATFSNPRERGKAFGVFGTVAVGGGAVGLILGGVLTQYLSWRWCMYVNVLFAAAAFIGAVLYMSELKPPVRPRVDFIGTALAAIGLFGLVFGFSQAEIDGWASPVTITSLIVGGAFLIGFVLAERVVKQPLLPLRVVADRSRGMAFAAVGIAGIAMFGLFLFLTYYLQIVKGFSPAMSGLAFLPMIGCAMISSNTSNIVTLPRFGPRIVITVGMALGFLALGYLSRLDVHSSYASGVLPALILMGLAMGMVMSPSMNTATAGVQPQDSGVASALVSTMQQVGGSIGTAVLSTMAASATTAYAHSHVGTSAFASATHGYTVVFLSCAVVFAAGGVLAAVFFPSKARLAAMRESVAASAVTRLETEMLDEVGAIG